MEGHAMDSSELKIFKEVAYTKSISKAAENLGYVQSNITAHIKKLESELNTTLLIRHNKGVTLTQDGEKLLHQAEQIIDLLNETLQSFKNRPKTLKIGATQTIASYLLPKCLIEYQKMFPNVSLSVSTSNQTDLAKQLAHGQLDCILTNSSNVFEQAKQIFQAQETLMIVTPACCKTLDDIWKYPVVINNIKSCPYREILLSWWLSHCPLPQIIELDTVEAILNTIIMGGGISLLPKTLLLKVPNINSFYFEELQTTSLHMWIPKDKITSECYILKAIIEKSLQE